MSSDQRFFAIMGLIATIGLPSLAFTLRMMAKWTRVELKLEQLVIDMRELVDHKDKVHQEIFTTIREDRKATDIRLRWLEENLWKRGQRAIRNP